MLIDVGVRCRDDVGQLRVAARVRWARVAHLLRLYRLLGGGRHDAGAAGVFHPGLAPPIDCVQPGWSAAAADMVVSLILSNTYSSLLFAGGFDERCIDLNWQNFSSKFHAGIVAIASSNSVHFLHMGCVHCQVGSRESTLVGAERQDRTRGISTVQNCSIQQEISARLLKTGFMFPGDQAHDFSREKLGRKSCH